MLMADLKRMQNQIKVSKTNNGDAISSIVVAIEMMETLTKKLKYQRKIVLMTDGMGLIDADDMDEIAKKLNDDEIELVVM